MKQDDKQIKQTLADIHHLYSMGKIDRDTHNRWCAEACRGATSFEQ